MEGACHQWNHCPMHVKPMAFPGKSYTFMVDFPYLCMLYSSQEGTIGRVKMLLVLLVGTECVYM